MSELPAGWIETTLGSVCTIVGGSTPKTSIPEYWNGKIPWITPDDLSRHQGKLIRHGARDISEAGYQSCSTKMVPAGTVLFTSRAPIGYVAIAAQPVCTNQGFKSFIPPAGVSSDYLYWYLRYATPTVRMMGSGTTFAEISGKKAMTIPFRLAPAAEQQRIVAAIEEQFSRLDAAEGSLHRVFGRLSALKSLLLESTVNDAWPSHRIGDLGAVITGLTPSTKDPSFWGSALPFMTPGDLHPGGAISAASRGLSSRGAEVVRRLPVGAVLVTCIGATIGKTSLTTVDCATNQQINAVAPDPEVVLSEFLLMMFTSSAGQRMIREAATTTTLPLLNKSRFSRLELPIPPIEEQRRLLMEIERKLSVIDATRLAVESAIRRSGVLRQILLHRAFAGQLLPQDPANEPAHVLLGQSLTERNASGDGQASRKCTTAGAK